MKKATEGISAWFSLWPALLIGTVTVTPWHCARAEASRLERPPHFPEAKATGAVNAKPGASRRIDEELHTLHREYRDYEARGGKPLLGEFRPFNRSLPVRDNRYVVVDVTATADTAATVAALQKLGCRNLSSFQRVTSAECPIDAMDRLDAETSIHFVRPALARHRSGAVTSQGDQAMAADQTRTAFGLSGAGITVGVLSDSYDCNTAAITHAAADVASGDLPGGVTVLTDMAAGTGCTDEGRAMMQLVHDVAPGAAEAFHTAFLGTASFANGILALRNTAHADIIVDDVIYFDEPMFQDGPIAQAVDQVVASGAAYFSSAGNDARVSYEATFNPSTSSNPSKQTDQYGGVLHDFRIGSGTDVYQAITLPVGTTSISFQWDEPFFSVGGLPGSASDYDIWICQSDTQPVNTTNCPVNGLINNINGDPVEIVQPTVSGSTGTVTVTVYLAIARYSGPANNRLKYVIFDPAVSIAEYNTASSTLFGHANSAGAAAVGAAAFYQTPAFGVAPPLLEYFSSAGGTQIRFDNAGNAIAPVARQKPEIVAPDGGNTTFFYADSAADADTLPNFFGTSAAAPHAAGVAALMLGAAGGPGTTTPTSLYAALESSAIDMATAGFDYDTGFGLVSAQPATVAVSADLSVGQTTGSAPALLGGQIVYTVNVENHGPAVAHNAVVSETLPASVSFLSAASGCSHVDGVVNCPLGDIASGALVTREIAVVANAEGNVEAVAAVVAATLDPVGSNNGQSLQVTIAPAADLQIAVDAPTGPVFAGDTVTYHYTVTNTGPSIAQAVTVSAELPASAIFVEASPGCALTVSTIECAIGDLAPNIGTTGFMSLQYPTAGDVDLSIAVHSTTADANPANGIVVSGITVNQPVVLNPPVSSQVPAFPVWALAIMGGYLLARVVRGQK